MLHADSRRDSRAAAAAAWRTATDPSVAAGADLTGVARRDIARFELGRFMEMIYGERTVMRGTRRLALIASRPWDLSPIPEPATPSSGRQAQG